MSKELEALENIKHYDTRVGLHIDDYSIIEKALKALEIIKEKGNICLHCVEYQDYDDWKLHHISFIDTKTQEFPLTQEEYDLLKEVSL